MFFDIVESGLSAKFNAQEIPRILKFCAYAKEEIPKPIPQVKMHDPCEEFIDGLTAQPWWNSDDRSLFPWMEGKKERKKEILILCIYFTSFVNIMCTLYCIYFDYFTSFIIYCALCTV